MSLTYKLFGFPSTVNDKIKYLLKKGNRVALDNTGWRENVCYALDNPGEREKSLQIRLVGWKGEKEEYLTLKTIRHRFESFFLSPQYKQKESAHELRKNLTAKVGKEKKYQGKILKKINQIRPN